MRRTGTAPVSVAPAPARIESWVAASTPLAKVTMKGTLAASGAAVEGRGSGRESEQGRVRGRSRSRIGRRRRSRVCGRLGCGLGGRFRGGLRVGSAEGSAEGSVDGGGVADGSADGSAAETNAGPSRLIHRIATCNRTTVVDATRRRRDEPPVNIDIPLPSAPARCRARAPPIGARCSIARLKGEAFQCCGRVPDAAIGGTTEAGTDSALRTLRFRCRATPAADRPHPVPVSVLLPIPPHRWRCPTLRAWRSSLAIGLDAGPRNPRRRGDPRCARARTSATAFEATHPLPSRRPARPRGRRTRRRAPPTRRDRRRRPHLRRGQPPPARRRHR